MVFDLPRNLNTSKILKLNISFIGGAYDDVDDANNNHTYMNDLHIYGEDMKKTQHNQSNLMPI
jgi:hypothetical protein